MPNTALNRTVVANLTNKSGGNLAFGDVVIGDISNAKGFTTTTSGALATKQIGVIIEPNGIANNALGLVAFAGWVPQVNLNTAATPWQFIKTHTVAGQATPHDSPQVAGDFGVALQASATPEAILFGSANHPATGGTISDGDYGDVTVSGSGTVITIDNGVVTVAKLATGAKTGALVFTFESEATGTEIADGLIARVRIPIALTLTAWSLGADQAGDIVLDVWKDTHANYPPDNSDSITNGHEPELSGVDHDEDTNISDWTTVSVSAGDWIFVNVDSCTDIEQAVLILYYTKA